MLKEQKKIDVVETEASPEPTRHLEFAPEQVNAIFSKIEKYGFIFVGFLVGGVLAFCVTTWFQMDARIQHFIGQQEARVDNFENLIKLILEDKKK